MGGALLTCPEGTASSAGGVQGYCTWLWVVWRGNVPWLARSSKEGTMPCHLEKAL